MRSTTYVYVVCIAALAASTFAQLNRRQSAAETMSLVYETMPLPSRTTAPIPALAGSTAEASTLTASASTGSSVSVEATNSTAMTSEYMSTATVTASSSSSKNYNSSKPLTSTLNISTSTVLSANASAGFTTANFTSGQPLPTSIVLETAHLNSTGDSAPTSTYTSWYTVPGSVGTSSGAGGPDATGSASTQNRPSGAARGSVPAKSSCMALGGLICFMVVFA